jgi:hypothetical protein
MTLLALSNDEHFGPFVPVASPSHLQASIKGNAALLQEQR